MRQDVGFSWWQVLFYRLHFLLSTIIINILCITRSGLLYFYWHCNIIWLCSWTLVILTTFSSRSQSSRVFIKHIQLHANRKPTFTIACTIIIVIIHAIPNRTLQQLNPIKINNRNRIFNGRAKLGYLTLLFQVQLASVSILIQFAVCATFEVVFTKLLDFFSMWGVRLNIVVFVNQLSQFW